MLSQWPQVSKAEAAPGGATAGGLPTSVAYTALLYLFYCPLDKGAPEEKPAEPRQPGSCVAETSLYSPAFKRPLIIIKEEHEEEAASHRTLQDGQDLVPGDKGDEHPRRRMLFIIHTTIHFLGEEERWLSRSTAWSTVGV